MNIKEKGLKKGIIVYIATFKDWKDALNYIFDFEFNTILRYIP